MTNHDVLTGDILDETMLSLDEIAQACSVRTDWVIQRVEAGLLTCSIQESTTWHFASADLTRAKRLATIEQDFEANEELAALVVDLIEEVGRLKHKLKTAGVDSD
jgi:chaperone modulatory protein CbpM